MFLREGIAVKIRRLDVIIQAIFASILLVVGIWALVMSSDRVTIGLSAGALVWSLNNIRISRCPHCGKHGLRPNPFKSNAGFCKYCDELVEYGVEYE